MHTVPLADAPMPTNEPLDPRACLAMLVERSHTALQEQANHKAVLENIRAAISRLGQATQAFKGADQQLAKGYNELSLRVEKLQDQVKSLEKWRSYVAGNFAILGAGSAFAAILLEWAVSHIHFS